MKKQLVIAMLAVAAFGLFTTSVSVYGMGKPKSADNAMPAAKESAHYMCPKCHMLSETGGKCAMCGTEMVHTHILAIKGNEAYCCACGATCKCKGIGADMTKCSCGKDAQKVNIKGKYVCSAGDKCQCNTCADKPGKCPYGCDLKKVE